MRYIPHPPLPLGAKKKKEGKKRAIFKYLYLACITMFKLHDACQQRAFLLTLVKKYRVLN